MSDLADFFVGSELCRSGGLGRLSKYMNNGDIGDITRLEGVANLLEAGGVRKLESDIAKPELKAHIQ